MSDVRVDPDLPFVRSAKCVRVASSVHVYVDGAKARMLTVGHYGEEPLFMSGLASSSYSLGSTLRRLLAAGGYDQDTVDAVCQRCGGPALRNLIFGPLCRPCLAEFEAWRAAKDG